MLINNISSLEKRVDVLQAIIDSQNTDMECSQSFIDLQTKYDSLQNMFTECQTSTKEFISNLTIEKNNICKETNAQNLAIVNLQSYITQMSEKHMKEKEEMDANYQLLESKYKQNVEKLANYEEKMIEYEKRIEDITEKYVPKKTSDELFYRYDYYKKLSLKLIKNNNMLREEMKQTERDKLQLKKNTETDEEIDKKLFNNIGTQTTERQRSNRQQSTENSSLNRSNSTNQRMSSSVDCEERNKRQQRCCYDYEDSEGTRGTNKKPKLTKIN